MNRCGLVAPQSVVTEHILMNGGEKTILVRSLTMYCFCFITLLRNVLELGY